jgi:RNA recognition motif-containing protein
MDRGDRDGGFRGGRGRGGRGGGAASYSETTVHLSDYVNSDNRYKCLKMRGLPFSVSIKEIRDFFNDFRVADRDIIIDMNRGKPTGYALVFLESDSEAERAKTKLNKQYLGSRYVDLNYPELR